MSHSTAHYCCLHLCRQFHQSHISVSAVTDLHVLINPRLASHQFFPVELLLFLVLKHIVSDQTVGLDVFQALPHLDLLHLCVQQHWKLLLASMIMTRLYNMYKHTPFILLPPFNIISKKNVG